MSLSPPTPLSSFTLPLYISNITAAAAITTKATPLIPFLTPAPVKGLAPVYCTLLASVEVALPEVAARAVKVESSDATGAAAEEVGGADTLVDVARVVLASSVGVLVAAGVLLVAGKAALLLETDGAA